MNEVRNSGNNIRSYAEHKNADRSKAFYLSDEALRELIEATEAEPMMRPPKGFKDEVITRIHRKRQRAKNMSLFSYSMKVIAATAAALSLVLIVPEIIRPEENGGVGERFEWQDEEFSEEKVLEEEPEREDFLYRFSNRLDGVCSALNGRLNQLVGTEGHY